MAKMLIKPDPDTTAASPAVFADDALYEDTHDELEFSDNAFFQQGVMLARVPRDLWEAWSKLPDDAEVRVGTMRVVTTTTTEGQQGHAFHIKLSPDLPQHHTVPQEYELDAVAEQVKNTYVFTEQNLPGYKKGSYERDRENNIPAKFRQRDQKFDHRVKEPAGDVKKRKDVDWRKPIPKRTCIAGKIVTEFNCLATEDELERSLIRRMQKVKGEAPRTIYHNDMINTGMLSTLDQFANFVRTDQPVGNVKPQVLKAARMPLNELRDAIFACFREFTYWSMKALRNRLQQPEAYLRETLDGMALLARSGRFNGHWFLKPESTGYAEGLAGLEAPIKDEGGASTVAPDDDDEDVDFEDVVA